MMNYLCVEQINRLAKNFGDTEIMELLEKDTLHGLLVEKNSVWYYNENNELKEFCSLGYFQEKFGVTPIVINNSLGAFKIHYDEDIKNTRKVFKMDVETEGLTLVKVCDFGDVEYLVVSDYDTNTGCWAYSLGYYDDYVIADDELRTKACEYGSQEINS